MTLVLIAALAYLVAAVVLARALALDSTQASPTGILVNTYKVVGPLQNQR